MKLTWFGWMWWCHRDCMDSGRSCTWSETLLTWETWYSGCMQTPSCHRWRCTYSAGLLISTSHKSWLLTNGRIRRRHRFKKQKVTIFSDRKKYPTKTNYEWQKKFTFASKFCKKMEYFQPVQNFAFFKDNLRTRKKFSNKLKFRGWSSYHDVAGQIPENVSLVSAYHARPLTAVQPWP